MKIGILTGGGDCPGLNAVIRAVVRKGILNYGYTILGVYEGWKGLIDNNLVKDLTLRDVSGILHRGGTVLRSSRTNPFKVENGTAIIKSNLKRYEIDALIAVGGEDTLGVASRLSDQGIKIVGVPKTIDNDVMGTERTFGFDTAVNIATEAIDRIHTTAESHNRVMIVEVMGRHAGWIAIEAGIAGGADIILIPEKITYISDVCKLLKQRHNRGKDFSVVVVAEGARLKKSPENGEEEMVLMDKKLDAFGHVRLGGIGAKLADLIETGTGYEARAIILGYIQRGGTPTAFDRVLATRFGVKAIDLVRQGKFGNMVALQANKIVPFPLAKVIAQTKTVDPELVETAEVFFG
ncbi:MAG TPA: ATP-dependent 6-phosphofructokinase [candidate division Zixibacteria bacterium]|nr:ATP-dependent 6-phosphofructokinase [candidate division Zixibacteria bacterium]